MSTDITGRKLGGRAPVSAGVARRLQAEESVLAAQAIIAHETLEAKGLVFRSYANERLAISRILRQAIDEDPLNLGVLDALQALDQEAAAIIRRIGR